jgi:hypothetical protein
VKLAWSGKSLVQSRLFLSSGLRWNKTKALSLISHQGLAFGWIAKCMTPLDFCRSFSWSLSQSRAPFKLSIRRSKPRVGTGRRHETAWHLKRGRLARLKRCFVSESFQGRLGGVRLVYCLGFCRGQGPCACSRITESPLTTTSVTVSMSQLETACESSLCHNKTLIVS